MNDQKKLFRVLDGGSNGGVERGLAYYCEEYGVKAGESNTLYLKGVVRIEALFDDADFHTDLQQPVDMALSTDGQYQTNITTL